MNFETRWRSMPTNPESAAFQRVDASHPLDFYLGRETTGEWVLLLVGNALLTITREYATIHVTARHRQDGRCALMFRLTQVEFGKLFSLVCEDLVESTRNAIGERKPASLVMKRFARWQRLLERGHSGLLDESELRGLLGELLFLERHAIPARGAREALAGWLGPSGGDRDFVFADHQYEIKTIRTGSESVLISSAEQLDQQTSPLDLVVGCLDEIDPSRYEDGFTALALVERIRATLEQDALARASFEDRLIEAGFVFREEYAERAYVFRQFRYFRVGADFPAIRRSELPPAIGRVRWELHLPSLTTYELLPAGN